MNRTITKVVVTPIHLLFFAGCSSHSSLDSNDNPGTNSELKYYGFAVVDCGWDDPHDIADKTNYVDEISGFANIGHMCVSLPTESLSSRIAGFSQAGVKVLLHIEALLFEHTEDASTPSGTRVTLDPAAEAIWAEFVTRNRDVLAPEYVAAFYVVDEPIWNGVEHADYVQALQVVKASLPNIPTLSIEAYPVLNQMAVPETLDWIGFDRYDTADPSNDNAWLADLETVRAARTRSDQRIMVVASTQWLPYYQTNAGIHPEDMESVVRSYYDIAASDPDVVALAGYLWPGGLDDPAQLGARNLPANVQQTLREIGEQIINRE